MDKKWYLSKTLWVNILTLIAALLPPVHDFVVQLGWSPTIVVSILASVNVLLRLLTGQAIAKKVI